MSPSPPVLQMVLYVFIFQVHIILPNMSSNTSPMRKCAAIARQEIAAAVIVTYLKFQDD